MQRYIKQILLASLPLMGAMFSMQQRPLLQHVKMCMRSIINWPESLACIAHEGGHALAAKILLNSPINIHIGAYYEELPKSIQKTSGEKAGITLHSFNFAKGYCCYTSRKNKRAAFLIDLAGPLSGILLCAFLKKYIDQIKPRGTISLLLKEMSRYLIVHEMIWQVVFNLTPLYQKSNGDGYRIWDYLNIIDKTNLQKVATFDRKQWMLFFGYKILQAYTLYRIKKQWGNMAIK